ncbi:MAG: hypothetical protein HYX34_05770 [Actinobacteria bacterium]|nr:hypothetical protein [Actinomycetota bacterium]
MFLPSRCGACDQPGPSPCATCAGRVRRAAPAPAPRGLSDCRALLAYEGAARQLVARLKYRNARASLRWLAGGMAQLVDTARVDVVTWAPTTGARRRGRGFDQAELLARAVAADLGLPVARLVRRLDGPAQTGRSGVERRAGPRVEPISGSVAAGRRVLVVDDVVTTGGSLSAVAAALHRAGAADVRAVVAARTESR